MIRIDYHHLGARRGVPADLIAPAARSPIFQETHQRGGLATARQNFSPAAAQRGKLCRLPEP